MQGKTKNNLLGILGSSLDRTRATYPSESAARLSERIASLKQKGVHDGAGTDATYTLLAGELMHDQNKVTTHLQNQGIRDGRPGAATVGRPSEPANI